MIKKALLTTLGVALTSSLLMSTAQAGEVLDKVKAKGFVQCGVSQGLPGFSNTDVNGEWSGLDVDFCRGVAAAIFGDATKVKFSPLSASERFTALQSGEIDLLSRNTTWTQTRDTSLGINFAGVTYYDGQGFMVRKDLGVTSALELDGASVCTNQGTTTEVNLADYFRANNMTFEPVVFVKADEVVAAYDSGRCDVYTTDASGLAAQRTKLAEPAAHIVLPEIISKEPLGPAVRHGDDQFFDVVSWVINATVEAEEMGLTSSNISRLLVDSNSATPAELRFVGREGALGENLGLDAKWSYNVIRLVGNYGEIWDRNISGLELPRGLNNLWNNGGIMYAPPVR
ncbi:MULTISPECIES: amino acid ABC transporter substrate-binding protein [Reinekea]|jgi:general L-amino acid transport system substrate-binding protein|uniref:amino acid ABC transporter substrate-binding protein n=1 Tax=Reinekea TaxID=230494 RepID=UPI0023537BF4|nr:MULTISPECIES: amino acid ABC transporter substrate-binding protein [Reinekea]MDO7640923.1 amino acid ABC transporter substrate-binding protein [Reinekea forsetii]